MNLTRIITWSLAAVLIVAFWAWIVLCIWEIFA